MSRVGAYTAILRIGLAEAVAYRAEFLVWMLTTTMPLVMLALWTAVAASGGPFQGFQQADFVAYYLAAMIVRTVTSTWVVWQMNQEIRMGTLSLRLLRPIHPFVAYSAEHLAAIPLRAALALPVAVIMLLTAGGGPVVPADPVRIAALLGALAGAWLLLFLTMLVIGTLGLYLERSLAIYEVWWGLFAVMSGYLVPLALMPGWLRGASDYLPFRSMLGFPIELMIGRLSRATALRELGLQWGWACVLLLLTVVAWRRGLKRFEAFGA